MDKLADDLVLLSIRPNGVIGTATKLRFGLSGAELVRLAALRRVDIERGRIIILDRAQTGDVLLDEALMSMEGLRPLTAKAWVAHFREDVTRRYLERLVSAGTIRAERRKAVGLIPVTGWTVLDAGRLAAARARLDAIAYGAGGVDSGQAALAGLASAIGLPSLVYPGFAGRAARKRVTTVGRNRAPEKHVTKEAADVTEISDTALDAAARSAAAAAGDAALRATADAAVQASIDAATQAAVSAATDAAHHAASDGGHVGGGHH
jgi:Golgi phosphoprotein 3 (GPP34)